MDDLLLSFERSLPWVWWDRDEPETDLLGFHTAEDRDAFARGDVGPFRRRVARPGQTGISQTEDWDGMMDRLCAEAGIDRKDRT